VRGWIQRGEFVEHFAGIEIRWHVTPPFPVSHCPLLGRGLEARGGERWG
jgi:hypothetical protein